MFGFLKRVRDSELHRTVSFLVLSLEQGVVGAQLDRSTERAAMAIGADAYAVMPVFDPLELIALIKKLQPSVPMLQQSATEEEKRRSE